MIVLAAIIIIGISKLQQEGKQAEITDTPINGIVSADPDVTTNSAEEPDVEADSEEEPASPYLLDHFPFTEEEVKSISASFKGDKKEIPVVRNFVVLQSLRFTDMQAAVTEIPSSTEQTALQFTLVDNRVIEVPYYLDNNSFEFEGKAYYADDQVLLLMHGLFRPNSELAVFDTLEERVRLEMEQAATTEPEGVEREKVAVDDLIYDQWEERLQNEKSDWDIPYYDNNTGQVREVRKFNNGILELNNKIVFTDSSHGTPDGIKVGLTEKEVVSKLDAEAWKLSSRWSYKSGDYFRFHLYYDDHKTKYIVLSQPL
ncbi:hypothetical protein D3C77_417590 [compost metagenome]